ncbi:MAG TPA: ATP-dependent Clp protease ATP-binding subunit, partial [Bacteroidetes bacterium]|nr:ATP-dependent Clp protease ATP-binding subunit [Bacteroidota bacterium]
HLMWYKFSPAVQLHTFHFEFSIGTNFIKGDFQVASFNFHGLACGLLPKFNNFMFVLGEEKSTRTFDLKNATFKIVEKLIRQYRKNFDNPFDIQAYTSNKKEFIANIQQRINVKNPVFSFQAEKGNKMFDLFRNEVYFDGGEEIESVSRELTSEPDGLRRAFYQDELVEYLHKLLFCKENVPVVLVGGEGTGRHTVLEEAVYRYAKEVAAWEDPWKRQYVWHINPNRIIAGMSIIGHWQKRFEAILKYSIRPYSREQFTDVILFDNPVALLHAGKSASGTLTLSKVMKPYLEQRSMKLVLIATPEEWKIIQESDRGFADLFQTIRMSRPDFPTAIKIILENRRRLEVQHQCNITIPAINQLFTIQRNFLKNKALPGSVMKMLTQIAAKYSNQKIDAPEVREEFQTISGLEQRIFDEQIKLDKNEIRDLLQSELIGQPRAVEVLTDAIHLIKAKLTDRSKPLASFLFTGPTGVGKTHAAKLLSKCLLGNEGQLMRFDMNEYIDAGALSRLIGNAHNPEGQLTGKVRYQPFGVVLLDEIEKAHPKILDLLLQMLDDARLTDSLGRTVDFSNTVIIMTSNLGAREAASRLGFQSSNHNDNALYRKAIENFFRPELVNRIGQIVIFNPLNQTQIQRIAQLQIKELLQRDGFVRRNTIVNVSEKALQWVAQRGFDIRMGGRALKRQIEKDLILLSARQLIQTTSEAPIILRITFENGHLTPHITPLEYCQPLNRNWLPNLPTESNIGYHFTRLLKKINRIEKTANQLTPKDDNPIVDPSQWQHFSFKERISQLKENINLKMLESRQLKRSFAPVIPFRLKRVFHQEAETGKARKVALRDKFFQTEALHQLQEEYRHGNLLFSSAQTDFLSSYINVAIVEIMLSGFLNRHPEKVLLCFRSGVTHSGREEIAWLMSQYANLFEKLELTFQWDKSKNQMEIEGYNLYHLLRNETGIHLFYIAHSLPVPVIVTLHLQQNADNPKPNTPATAIEPLHKVIRIYDSNNTITDLRTGYSNAFNLTTEEFKLLLYGGIHAE